MSSTPKVIPAPAPAPTPTPTPPKLSNTELAFIRTALANERTYLAFVRSGFAAIGLGLKMEIMYPTIVGIGFVLAGMYGYYRTKFILRRGGYKDIAGDNLLMELVVFTSLAILYWVFKKGKK